MNSLDNVRRRVVWEARHDNGWTTIIAEQKDGSFIASASNHEAVCVDYVGRNVTHAHAAVLAALRWKTGHRRCTDRCSEWRLLVGPSRAGPESEDPLIDQDACTLAASIAGLAESNDMVEVPSGNAAGSRRWGNRASSDRSVSRSVGGVAGVGQSVHSPIAGPLPLNRPWHFE